MAVAISKAYVDDIVVGEDKTFVDVVIRLDAANTGPVSLGFYTDSGTASTSDYFFQDGTIIFAAGETTKTVRILLDPDTSVEGEQVFYFNLETPSANVTIPDPFAEIRIIDDEAPAGAPNASVRDMVVDEAQGTVTFVIQLDRPSTNTVTMNYATQNGTALAGSDYVAKSGSLTFVPGEVVKAVTVKLTNDTAREGNETFQLALSNLKEAFALDPDGMAVIAANDGPLAALPEISVGAAVVAEDRSYMEFYIRLSQPSSSPVKAGYFTESVTASTSDYYYQESTITFAPGETVKTVRIVLDGDTSLEGNQTFTLNLQNVSGAEIALEGGTATATIVDDETPDQISVFGSLNGEIIWGTRFDDTVTSGAGDDFVHGKDGIDTLYGGFGNDILYGDAGNDKVSGDSGGDTLFGDLGADKLLGGIGSDVISGGEGNDTLLGENGQDILTGGAGRDIVLGGYGADSFIFKNGDFGGATTATADRIADFSQSQGDKIKLAGVDAKSGTAIDDAFTFIGSAAFGQVAGQLRFQQINGNTYVQGDQNGDGNADFMIRLDGLQTLLAADFVL